MSVTYRIELACDIIEDLLAMCNVTGRAFDGAVGKGGRSITATVKIAGSMRHVPAFADMVGRENVRFSVMDHLLVDFPLLEETPCPEQSL